MNFNFISKLFSIKSFTKLLKDRVFKAFDINFNKTNKEFGYTSAPNPDVLDYMRQREIILSKKTMDRLTGNLEYAILESIKNRESITEVKERLNDIFVGMKDYEIERVARTEVLNAQNAGTFNSHLEAGIVQYKVWHANLNNKRTGADSKRLHGQVQPIDKPFRDPLTRNECQHSPNRPNCRCSIMYYVDKPNVRKKNGLEYKI